MLNVTTATKNKYRSDSTHKQIGITIYADSTISLTNEDIVSESMEIKENLCKDTSIEFVGCIASQFSVTVHNITEDIKGKRIAVTVKSGETETINLFHGYINSVELTGVKREKKIVAYDILYNWQDTDIAAWYKGLTYPITLGDFRNSLFQTLGVAQEETTLVLDELIVNRRYNPTQLSAIEIIKSICQINCVFGKINRDGKFEYVVPVGQHGSETLSYYKTAKYQEYTVKPVDKLVIKYGDVEGVYGGGNNTYTIQNNIFTNGFTSEELQSIAQTVYANIESFTYRPFAADINGLPYLECLDTVSMEVEDVETTEKKTLDFVVLNRVIRGCQSLRDNTEAEGEEYQKEFVTDLSLSIDELKRIVEVMREDMDDLKMKYYLFSNSDGAIEIGDGETQKIIDVRFQATKNTIVVFQAEVLGSVITTVEGNDYHDANVKIIYRLDDVFLQYSPEQTWLDGKHLLHLLKYFHMQSAGELRHLEVFLKMTGASIEIGLEELNGCISGQNLVASDDLGYVEISEAPIDWDLISLSGFDTATDSVRFPDNDQRTTQNGDIRVTQDGDNRIGE